MKNFTMRRLSEVIKEMKKRSIGKFTNKRNAKIQQNAKHRNDGIKKIMKRKIRKQTNKQTKERGKKGNGYKEERKLNIWSTKKGMGIQQKKYKMKRKNIGTGKPQITKGNRKRRKKKKTNAPKRGK